MIRSLLVNKQAKEKAKLKGQEIAKIKSVPRTRVLRHGTDIDIEVVSISPIEDGIEVYARAWDSNGQIGFGNDGSVDVERFLIHNPPILVQDSLGDVELDASTEGSGRKTLKYREDLREALLQHLTRVVKATTGNNPRNQIIPGKVGSTTSTFLPDPDPETTSCDGIARRTGVTAESWTTIRGGAGTLGRATGSAETVGFVSADGTNTYDGHLRAYFLFDTSSLPDTDNIDSGSLTFYTQTTLTTLSGQSIGITAGTPASNTDIADTDYPTANFGSTRFATDISVASLTQNGDNVWDLNASGLAAISKTGITKFAARTSGDIDDSDPGGSAGQDSGADFRFADSAGTADDPLLTVVHSAPSAGGAVAANHWLLMGV